MLPTNFITFFIVIVGVDLSAALASITDTRDKEYATAQALKVAKGGAAADKDVKAAIMAQYSQVRERSIITIGCTPCM